MYLNFFYIDKNIHKYLNDEEYETNMFNAFTKLVLKFYYAHI